MNKRCSFRVWGPDVRRLLPLLVVATLCAQTGAEPEYINAFAALDKGGNLVDLERAMVTFRSKIKALPGYASAKMMAEFKPGQSPVRLPRDAQFVVRGRAPVDPLSRFELLLLKRSKGHRDFVMTTAHGTIVGATSDSEDGGSVAIRFQEYGAASYRIIPDQPLAPGEYALAVRGLPTEVYCFGVDK